MKRNSSANNKQVTTSSPNASAPPNKIRTTNVTQSPTQVPSCTACGVQISNEVKALQCDRCQADDKWKCSQCLNLKPELYEHLVSDPNCTLRWFCTACDNYAMETGRGSCSYPDDAAPDKLDSLIKLVESFLAKLATFEDKIKDKCDVDVVQQLDTRVRCLEAHVVKQDTELDSKTMTLANDIAKVSQLELEMEKRDSVLSGRLASLEDQMNREMIPSSLDKENAISDEEMIKVMVKEEMEKKLRKNVI